MPLSFVTTTVVPFLRNRVWKAERWHLKGVFHTFGVFPPLSYIIFHEWKPALRSHQQAWGSSDLPETCLICCITHLNLHSDLMPLGHLLCLGMDGLVFQQTSSQATKRVSQNYHSNGEGDLCKADPSHFWHFHCQHFFVIAILIAIFFLGFIQIDAYHYSNDLFIWVWDDGCCC